MLRQQGNDQRYVICVVLTAVWSSKIILRLTKCRGVTMVPGQPANVVRPDGEAFRCNDAGNLTGVGVMIPYSSDPAFSSRQTAHLEI